MSIGVLSQRHIELNPVATATPVLVFQCVAADGQVGDNAEGAASLGPLLVAAGVERGETVVRASSQLAKLAGGCGLLSQNP